MDPSNRFSIQQVISDAWLNEKEKFKYGGQVQLINTANEISYETEEEVNDEKRTSNCFEQDKMIFSHCCKNFEALKNLCE